MFTLRDIKWFVQASQLPAHANKNLLYPLLSKDERLKIINETVPHDEESGRIAAAIEIQRVWRGYRTRSILFSLQPVSQSVSRICSFLSSPTLSELDTSLSHSKLNLRAENPLDKIQSRIEMSYKGYLSSRQMLLEQNSERQDRLLTFKEFCAYTIQTWWRTILKRWRKQKSFRRNKKRKKPTREEATQIIQKAWRRHIDTQVFKYYKALISLRCHGDPDVMLRCINPRECEVLDAGSGLHVRFRLGGTKFPPSIYYKICSHINVADIGSFAPRNYVQTKHLPSKFVHNKNELYGLEKSLETDWYQRVENNGWRLVCDRFLHMDINSYDDSNQTIHHPPAKLTRKQDVARRKKRKKIKWMKSMYEAGALQRCDSTTSGDVFNDGVHNVDGIDDWEVDEILEWTNGLNYYSYLQDWNTCGTTRIIGGNTKEQEKFATEGSSHL